MAESVQLSYDAIEQGAQMVTHPCHCQYMIQNLENEMSNC